MDTINIQDICEGVLKEKLNQAFQTVMQNMQDRNTSYKDKRSIEMKLTFGQNENRDRVEVSVSVKEKLAPQAPVKTQLSVEKDLETGEIVACEYGRQIKGQMNLDDYRNVDGETGEIIDYRAKAAE